MLERLFKNAPCITSLMWLSILVSVVGWINPYAQSLYGMHTVFLVRHDYLNFGLQLLLFQFFHGDIIHLLSNLFFLFFIGIGVEQAIGKGRVLTMFLLSTFTSAIVILFLSNGITIGISTFCMALITYYALTIRDISREQAKGAFLLIFINIALGFFGSISFAGHLGGAIGGGIYYLLEKAFYKKK